MSKKLPELLMPFHDEVQRLTAIPGIGPGGAERIVLTLGPSASTFHSGRALACWLGVCPGVEQSGGTHRSAPHREAISNYAEYFGKWRGPQYTRKAVTLKVAFKA